MTAYREEALAIAAALSRLGPASPKALRSVGASPKTGRVLLDNHYGWFDHPAKGVYALSEPGREALAAQPELAADLLARFTF
jgi:hypothetical protein